MSDQPILFHIREYRGATIEDLDIKPAISVNPSTHLNEALEISYENEFTYLPVIHETNKRLLGILNVEQFKNNTQYEHSAVKPLVKNYMLWFHQKSRENYEKEHLESTFTRKTPINTTILKPKSATGKKFDILTPLTPLEELAEFFNQGSFFAIITNDEGNIVYGVATPEDLIRYENSRPKL